MKKIIALIIAVVTVFAAMPALAVSFTDLSTNHWAYPAVSELVDKGTIKGYTDGSFKPDNTVTRAEFVKMVGEGTEKRANDYNDVPKDHWAYKYVITSGFNSDDKNNFNPDTPITRAQTVQLLYSRFGKPDVEAPDFVKAEAKKYHISVNALSWIYTYGILVGDDGINLRLGDTLTRAEAAALIVKCGDAVSPKNFADIVSGDILKDRMSKLNIFEGGYNSDATMTNAQLADAMIRFANNISTTNISGYVIKDSIEHEKSDALYIMCNSSIGLENFTVKFADSTATIKTAKMAARNAAERLIGGTVTQAQADSIFAAGNGNATNPVTQKDIAAMVVMYDILFGSQYAYTTDLKGENYTKINMALENDMSNYPRSYKNYAVILKDIPHEVYDHPITSGSGSSTPAENFDFARDYAALFTAKCADYVMAADKGFGVKLRITFYPSLAYANGKGFAFKVKVTALNSSNYTPADLFGDKVITQKDVKLTEGMEFFTEIAVESII